MNSGAVQRTVIIGNGGSGKSWLAEQLSSALSIPAIDLDLIHWEPGGYEVKRDADVALAMVRQAAAGPAWVIEGVYGWLVRAALPDATALVWLDIEIEECAANIMRRGLRRGADEASFAALLAWVKEYGVRDSASSLAGHRRLFTSFAGPRVVLRSRREMAAWLDLITQPRPKI
jgi:adenylate kinase family enzyme